MNHNPALGTIFFALVLLIVTTLAAFAIFTTSAAPATLL